MSAPHDRPLRPFLHAPFVGPWLSLGTVLMVVLVAATVVGTAPQAPATPAAQTPARQYPYPAVRDQRGVVPQGPTVAPYNNPVLGQGPWPMETYEQRNIRVSAAARGLNAPWSIAFLPDNVILITEKGGQLRVVRNGALEPAPVAGIPRVISMGTMAGLMDIALHPQFATNKWIYISYHKPAGQAPDVEGKVQDLASNSILRGTWTGTGLTDIKDIFVSDDVDTEVSRLAFGADGMLYMSIGGPGTGPMPSLIRPQHTDDYAGKILRMRDDGGVPPDNPFVGRSGYKPLIFSMGHRNQLGLVLNPWSKEIWEGEQGPNGGDELNIIRAGKNYGWPLISDGRDYRGPYISPSPFREGMERPQVLFVPSIAVSSLMFYTGTRFPNWQRNAFVGGMREGEIARTGQIIRIVFNDNWEELRREALLRDLHQRIRDIKQGPDGLIYAITDEGKNSVLLKLEPQ